MSKVNKKNIDNIKVQIGKSARQIKNYKNKWKMLQIHNNLKEP